MEDVIKERRPANLGMKVSKLLVRVREAPYMHTHPTTFSSVAEYLVIFIAKGMHNAGECYCQHFWGRFRYDAIQLVQPEPDRGGRSQQWTRQLTSQTDNTQKQVSVIALASLTKSF